MNFLFAPWSVELEVLGVRSLLFSSFLFGSFLCHSTAPKFHVHEDYCCIINFGCLVVEAGFSCVLVCSCVPWKNDLPSLKMRKEREGSRHKPSQRHTTCIFHALERKARFVFAVLLFPFALGDDGQVEKKMASRLEENGNVPRMRSPGNRETTMGERLLSVFKNNEKE